MLLSIDKAERNKTLCQGGLCQEHMLLEHTNETFTVV